MRWTINQNSDQKIINQLSNELSIDTTLAALLVNRGIVSFDDAKFFSSKIRASPQSVFDDGYGYRCKKDRSSDL